MKILALNGSPRKNGNTEILINEFKRGADHNNHQTEIVRLYPLDIKPCVDCRNCKKEIYRCTIKDDMREYYNKIDQADILLFGTPIYWYGPTAKMKLLIDRLRPYISNKKLKGKKAILVIPSEEGPAACTTTVEAFKMSFHYIGVEYLGVIYGTAYNRGDILNNENELKTAFEFGKNLL